MPPGDIINQLSATCPNGTTVIGGGFQDMDNSGDIVFTVSMEGLINDWVVSANNKAQSPDGNSHEVKVYAMCAKIT
jgi:hypothetical protein